MNYQKGSYKCKSKSKCSGSAMYYYCSISTVLFFIVLQVGHCGGSTLTSTMTSNNNTTDYDQYCEGPIENCRLSSKIVSKYEERLVKMNSYLESGLLYFLTNEIDCSRMASGPGLYNQTRASLHYMTNLNWKQILRNDTECMQQSSQLFCRQCLVHTNRCSSSCFDALELCTRHISNELGNSWKMALGSIQTAVRLLVSQDVKYGCIKKKNFSGELIAWREPFLDDQQDKLSCNLVDARDCSNSNKIKQTSSQRVITGYHLQQLRIKLDDIAKVLSAYWPRIEEPITPNRRSNEHTIYPETGSGSGQFYRNVLFEHTDDEDLLDSDGYGSGSEDLEGSGGDLIDRDLENKLDEIERVNNTKRLVPSNNNNNINQNNLNDNSGGVNRENCLLFTFSAILLLLLPYSSLTTIRLTT